MKIEDKRKKMSAWFKKHNAPDNGCFVIPATDDKPYGLCINIDWLIENDLWEEFKIKFQ